MTAPEENALRDVSAHLTRSLRHCAAEITELLFAAKLIPVDLYDRVSADPKTVGGVVMCLISRVKISPREFISVVEVLEQVSSLEAICQKLRESYNKHGGTLQLPTPPPPPPPPQMAPEPTEQPIGGTLSSSSGAGKHPRSLPQLQGCTGRKLLWSSIAVLCLAAIVSAAYHGLTQPDPDPYPRMPKKAAIPPSPGSCKRLKKNEDRKSLLTYFDKAYKLPNEAETLCEDYLKLKNCNDLQRDNKLKPFYLADSYLEQNPKACWEDIFRVLCELNKNTLAMEVAKEYHLNTEDCPDEI